MNHPVTHNIPQFPFIARVTPIWCYVRPPLYSSAYISIHTWLTPFSYARRFAHGNSNNNSGVIGGGLSGGRNGPPPQGLPHHLLMMSGPHAVAANNHFSC